MSEETITISKKTHVSLCRNTKELAEFHEYVTEKGLLLEFKEWKNKKSGA